MRRVTEAGVIDLPLPDQPARDAIRGDLDSNILVEAGAGSGKTTELLSRMVALLETGAARAEDLAAVTFTRKAAGELRARFQMSVEERLALHRTSGAADSVEVERLARGLDEIDRAFIGTIHAFCGRLLRERPLEVGLDPAFEEMAVEERVVERRRFWQAYLERLTRDADPVLEDLAKAGLKPVALYELFHDMVENPDVEFRAEAAEPASPDELAAVRQQLESLVDRAWELMPARPTPDWDSLQRKLRSAHFSRDVTGWTEPADLYEALGLLCKPGNPHDITQNRWRNGAQAKALRDDIGRFAVGGGPGRALYLRWLAHRYALAVRLAGRAAQEFTAHRRRTGKLDFQDLLTIAADLLRSSPEVRSDLGTRYRRLLVDEFQDTDPLQAEIVLLLSSAPDQGVERGDGAGATPAWRRAVPRPGALFVVGDPKQSIYRFRRADIHLYGLVKERFREFGRVLELTTNFRSRPAIGDVVNGLFNIAGFFPASATPEQAAFEPLNTRPVVHPVPREGVFQYDVKPPEANRRSLAQDEAARLAPWIRSRVEAGERRPGDFLILTRTKTSLGAYTRALEAHGLPADVTGAGVGGEEEIRELIVVLRCLVDPTNAVRVVAALVGLCFGLDYERLVEHRLLGGGFDAMHPGERGHADVLDALRALHAWWRAASVEPADVFVPRLVAELGLLPLAAAGDLGAVRAGALVFVLDAIRDAALQGDTSLPGAITAIESALDLAEAESPLEPERPDVVRLMNLHQAKGLEATVVVLADPSGHRDREPELHVERSDEGWAIAYARVTEAAEGRGNAKELARPSDWDAMASVERRFEAAEEVRLLYVAVTRAKEELVVARWREKPDVSPWRALHPWLDGRAELLEMERTAPPPRAGMEATAEDVARVASAAAAAVAAMSAPSYTHRTVTGIAEATIISMGADGAPPAQAPSAQELRGYAWGSAVHDALAAAARAPGLEPLRATCRDLLVEHGRPLDEHGEPVELEELTGLVRSVQASELWERAMRAERVLSEVSFALPGWHAAASDPERPAAPERPAGRRFQLDLFGAEAGASRPPEAARPEAGLAPGGEPRPEAPPVVLEGVIDLAFREQDGWVVADYKTDVGTDPEFPTREAAYRHQVELYARAWSRLTGDPVKERVLFFTSQGRVEHW